MRSSEGPPKLFWDARAIGAQGGPFPCTQLTLVSSIAFHSVLQAQTKVIQEGRTRKEYKSCISPGVDSTPSLLFLPTIKLSGLLESIWGVLGTFHGLVRGRRRVYVTVEGHNLTPEPQPCSQVHPLFSACLLVPEEGQRGQVAKRQGEMWLSRGRALGTTLRAREQAPNDVVQRCLTISLYFWLGKKAMADKSGLSEELNCL